MTTSVLARLGGRSSTVDPELDYSQVFRSRESGALVNSHVHEEPAPRVPDYPEIARRVALPEPTPPIAAKSGGAR